MDPQTSSGVSPQDIHVNHQQSNEIPYSISSDTITQLVRFAIKTALTRSANAIVQFARWAIDHPRIVLRRLGTVAISVASVSLLLLIEIHIQINVHSIRRSIVTLSLMLVVFGTANRWGRLESIAAALVAALGFDAFFQEGFGKLSLDAESLTSVFSSCFLPF